MPVVRSRRWTKIAVEKQTTTRTLINIFEGKKFPRANVNPLIDGASKNKVLLHVLRVLSIQGPLRE